MFIINPDDSVGTPTESSELKYKNMDKMQENIIKEMGLEELPKDAQEEILIKMTESVLKKIAIETLERLSDEDRDEFEKLQETAAPAEIDAFLSSKIENYEELLQKTVAEYKEEIKESINNLKKSLE